MSNNNQGEENANANPNYYDRVMAEMNAMDARIAEWHADEDIQNQFHRRLAMINNTDGYYTGGRVLQCRTIQMCDQEDWTALFGHEDIRPETEAYAQRCIRYDQNSDSDDIPYSGELEVSLLMEENAIPGRPGIHRAVFIIYMTPHQQFHDGHLIEMEIGEGSFTHQTINRMFDVNSNALVQQFTEYQILAFLSDDAEMTTLLYGYFLQDFNPMILDAQIVDDLCRHECRNIVNVVLHDGIDPEADDARVAAIPPPPPVNNFAAIYRANFGDDYDNDFDEERYIINDYYNPVLAPQNEIDIINQLIPIYGAYPDVNVNLPARG